MKVEIKRDTGGDGPFLPGRRLQGTWVPESDPEMRKTRDRVQEGAVVLYHVESPRGTRLRWDDRDPRPFRKKRRIVYDRTGQDFPKQRLLVEAYYPNELSEEIRERHLDVYRKAHMEEGRRVIWRIHMILDREITPQQIQELRIGNRAAYKHARRRSSVKAREIDLRNMRERREKEALKPFMDSWADASKEAAQVIYKHMTK